MTAKRQRNLGDHGGGKFARDADMLAFVVLGTLIFDAFDHGAKLASIGYIESDIGQVDAGLLEALSMRRLSSSDPSFP